jgi:enoyl-CoA hydratase/carnithine racemase
LNYKTLQFELRSHVGWLTLNRPQQHNALSWDMMLELRDFFGSLDDNLDVRVVVVRGAGGDFCVGLDLKSTPGFGGGWGTDAAVPGRFPPRGFMFLRKIFDIPIRMRQAPQPIICAVRGNAIGGGFGIAMASDIRLASETAKFNVGAPRLGLSAGDFAQSYFLPRLVGMSRAALYMFTSRFIDAATAERIGLVSQVVPDDQLDDATEELAQELLRISPFSLRMTKEVFNANIEVGNLLDATKLENRTQILCAYTDDSMEAIKATFVEKREPVYRDEG